MTLLAGQAHELLRQTADAFRIGAAQDAAVVDAAAVDAAGGIAGLLASVAGGSLLSVMHSNLLDQVWYRLVISEGPNHFRESMCVRVCVPACMCTHEKYSRASHRDCVLG